MKYAIIENNKVVNIAIADNPLETNWIQSTGAVSIGDLYQDGKFIQYDPKTDPVATEEQATAVRSDRNERLVNTDWTQVADAPVDKAAWATYRQALRDVTAQEGFPWNVTWPVQPE